MDNEKLKKLKYQVEFVLENEERARNDDNFLHEVLIRTFYRQYLVNIDGAMGVKLSSFADLPNRETIKRVRAKIQNTEGRFVPTSWQVAKARQWNEDKWKQALGYWVKD